jgi:two-component system LytT family response regulator
MKALILEDEELSMSFIEKIVTDNFQDFKVILKTGNLLEAAKLIKLHEPDLLLLDITLNDNNSMELFELFDHAQLNVIFITGHKNYGIDAIKHNAIDYILKPIIVEELVEAIRKGILVIEKKRYYKTHSVKTEKILVSFNNLKIPIENSDIVRIKSSGSYSVLHLRNNKSYTSTRNLGFYEDMLPKSDFIRIHHSTIININHIKIYDAEDGGRVRMLDGSYEKVSNRKKAIFFRIFNK